jgi:hypothetical protein
MLNGNKTFHLSIATINRLWCLLLLIAGKMTIHSHGLIHINNNHIVEVLMYMEVSKTDWLKQKPVTEEIFIEVQSKEKTPNNKLMKEISLLNIRLMLFTKISMTCRQSSNWLTLALKVWSLLIPNQPTMRVRLGLMKKPKMSYPSTFLKLKCLKPFYTIAKNTHQFLH